MDRIGFPPKLVEPLDVEIADLTTADDIAAAVREMYGADLASTGVVHVTAVHQRRDVYETLKIRPETPKCAHDFFVLNVARARADAIVTTGKILREEPAVVHRLQGPGRVADALAAWRRERLGKSRPPVTLVLTSGRGLDLGHPIFKAWTRPVVYTSRQGQWNLESQAADHGVEVVGVDEPGVHGAVDLLRYEFGAATISIEAGPSVSCRLYEPPPAVDELLLSVAEVRDLPQSVRGGKLLTAEDVARIFSRYSAPYRVTTADGEWRFQRFLR